MTEDTDAPKPRRALTRATAALLASGVSGPSLIPDSLNGVPTPSQPPRRQRITYFKKYGNTSRESLQNPPGSCLPELRAARVDRRARRMRLRKLRGWR